jgi:hypothetical protein
VPQKRRIEPQKRSEKGWGKKEEGSTGKGDEEAVDFTTSSSTTAGGRVFLVFRRGEKSEQFYFIFFNEEKSIEFDCKAPTPTSKRIISISIEMERS